MSLCSGPPGAALLFVFDDRTRALIDPFDVAAARYEVGEWLARIALSQTRPDHPRP